jgi:hypothetical protein
MVLKLSKHSIFEFSLRDETPQEFALDGFYWLVASVDACIVSKLGWQFGSIGGFCLRPDEAFGGNQVFGPGPDK